MDATLALTKQLIQEKTVTPEDGNCQKLIAARLEELGFKIENLPFGKVKNLCSQASRTTCSTFSSITKCDRSQYDTKNYCRYKGQVFLISRGYFR